MKPIQPHRLTPLALLEEILPTVSHIWKCQMKAKKVALTLKHQVIIKDDQVQ